MSGMRGINPRQMKQAMKQMGIKNTELTDVIEVIIRLPNEELVIKYPEVSIMEVKGSKTYQISGDSESRPVGTLSEETGTIIPAEDIELVMSQTGCTKEQAVKALEESDGQPAEAIIKIING